MRQPEGAITDWLDQGAADQCLPAFAAGTGFTPGEA